MAAARAVEEFGDGTRGLSRRTQPALLSLCVHRRLRRPAPERHTVGISYELKYPDGGDAGTFVTNLSDWAVGTSWSP